MTEFIVTESIVTVKGQNKEAYGDNVMIGTAAARLNSKDNMTYSPSLGTYFILKAADIIRR